MITRVYNYIVVVRLVSEKTRINNINYDKLEAYAFMCTCTYVVQLTRNTRTVRRRNRFNE